MTGAAGQVGRELVGALGPHDVFGCDHTALDVTDGADVRDAFSSIQPDVVVHCAAFTAVDACESEPDTAFAVNGRGTRARHGRGAGRGRVRRIRVDRLRVRRHQA